MEFIDLLSRARDLKKLGIPKKTRKVFIRESSSLCAELFGASSTMDEAIEDSIYYKLKDQEASNYIKWKMDESDRRSCEALANYSNTESPLL